MEHELYVAFNKILHDLSRSRCYQTSKQFTYDHFTIIRVYLWAVLHDRPTSWATQSRNWPASCKPQKLPCQSTMSRRLRCPKSQSIIHAISKRLGQGKPSRSHKIIDGKPLFISQYTQDPDTPKPGYAHGRYERGYKLYAIFSDQYMPAAWEVRPINHSELTVTREILLDQLSTHETGYLLGDKLYDANHVYEKAGHLGLQLVAPHAFAGKGFGHCKQSKYRLKGLAIASSDAARDLLNQRTKIEREFAQLIGFGGGLTCLPMWVRRLQRVKLWVWEKLVINALRKMRNAKCVKISQFNA